MRISIIDGFRGFFLFFMMVIHLNVELKTILGRLNHHYFGFVEDAQGFVFISGFVVGLVYTSKYLKSSYSDLKQAIWSRIYTIWTHQAGLVLIFLSSAVILSFFNLYPSILSHYANEPIFFTLASLGLVGASKHMGILPMYIYFLIVTPLVLKAFTKGYAPAILVLSVFLWTVGQTGILDWMSDTAHDSFAERGIIIDFGIFFNILSWQTIFFGGLWLGYLSCRKKLSLEFLKQPGYTLAAFFAVMLFIYFGLLDRAVHWTWVSESFSQSFKAQEVRADFSTVHVINFATDLFLMTWLIYAGRDSKIKFFEILSSWLQWLFTRRALVFLGQHSLHVFSFHLLIVYLVGVIFDSGPPDEITGSIVLVLGVASLYIPAWYNARNIRKRKARESVMSRPSLG